MDANQTGPLACVANRARPSLPIALVMTFAIADQGWGEQQQPAAGDGRDRGAVHDVRAFGAVPGWENEQRNTAAFQAAVDAAAAANGGTVYLPASTEEKPWDLATPIWVWARNITIEGAGSRATGVRARGPSFVMARHPRFWLVNRPTYTDVDTSMTVATTAMVDGVAQWVDLERYREDLMTFGSAGTFAPGDGRAGLDLPISAGQWFALRTRGGVAQGRFPYCPLATGDQNQTNAVADAWYQHEQLTWEFVVYHHEAALKGGIAGAGSVNAPDPWLLYGTPSLDGRGQSYVMELGLTDEEHVRRTWVHVEFPQVATVGLHRITFQFDPTNADETKRLSAWVDRTRVAVTVRNFSNVNRGYEPLNDTSDSGDLTNLWTVYDRVARWHEADFTIGSESVGVGRTDTTLSGQLSDYSIVAVAAHKGLKYEIGAVGSPQRRIDGKAADDTSVWPAPEDRETALAAIGWVANGTDWSPAGDRQLNVNLQAFGRGRLPLWGYMCPKGSGNWGMHDAAKNMCFKGITFFRRDGAPTSCGLLLGPYLDLRTEDLAFGEAGFFASIGSMFTHVSYYGRHQQLRLPKMIHLIHQTGSGNDWEFGYCNRSAIRLSGSQLELTNFSYPAPQAYDEGFLTALPAGSISCGISLKNGTINQEGLTFAPHMAVVYVAKHAYHGNNKLVIDNVQFGECAAPSIYLDDTIGDQALPTHVEIKGTGLSPTGPLVIVRGKDWAGTVEVGPWNLFTETVRYLDSSAETQFCDVKTVDRTSCGPPPCGGYVDRAHEIVVCRPAEGGVARWGVSAKDLAVAFEGTANPPDWIPLEMVASRRQHALSANVPGGLYLSCSLPWPAGTSTAMGFTSLSNGFAKSALAHILAAAPPPDRTALKLKWGYDNVNQVATGDYIGGFFESEALANADLWSPAAGAAKTTKRPIVLAGKDVPPWSLLINRRIGFALQVGSSGQSAAILGKTTSVGPSFWKIKAADLVTIPPGGLTVARNVRAGGWTDAAANRILDWMFGGAIELPAKVYVGLSTTPMSVAGVPTASEPAAGNYARVPCPRTPAQWGEVADSAYLWANKPAIQFEAPTNDWGVIRYVFLADAPTGGRILFVAPLNRPVRVAAGDDAPVFLPGALQIQL